MQKKSRFIAYVEPVEQVEQAEAMLERIRGAHPDATHVCYAYRTGRPSLVVRMSDDGEPQGTAGRPILEVMERQDVENTCIAVVRYFGGTLLGAAGLVRAYAAAAAAGLEAAGVATYVLHAALKARIDYPYFGKVERLLEALSARVVDANYSDSVEVQLVTPAVRVDAVIQGILNATNGTATIHRMEDRFFPLEQAT